MGCLQFFVLIKKAKQKSKTKKNTLPLFQIHWREEFGSLDFEVRVSFGKAVGSSFSHCGAKMNSMGGIESRAMIGALPMYNDQFSFPERKVK